MMPAPVLRPPEISVLLGTDRLEVAHADRPASKTGKSGHDPLEPLVPRRSESRLDHHLDTIAQERQMDGMRHLASTTALQAAQIDPVDQDLAGTQLEDEFSRILGGLDSHLHIHSRFRFHCAEEGQIRGGVSGADHSSVEEVRTGTSARPLDGKAMLIAQLTDDDLHEFHGPGGNLHAATFQKA